MGRAGLALCALGLVANEFVLAAFLTGDGSFESPWIRGAIWGMDLVLVTAGLAIYFGRRSGLGVNLLLALGSLALLAPLCGELALRAGIAMGLEPLRDPWLYAGWCDDEVFWKLRYHWREPGSDIWDTGLVFDEHLGWTMGDDAGNDAITPCDGCPSPLLVYGDSFAYGVPPTVPEDRLPQRLGALLPERPLVNYAASGYGFDQIYLRLSRTLDRHDASAVVVGIMTLDLDRSLFAVRDAPKPYYKLDGDQLELRGVPLPADTDAWHRDHPPRIWSYLGALLGRRITVAKGGPIETEIPYRRAEKQRLNGAILEALVGEVREAGRPLLVVLFVPPWQFPYEGWREVWLKDELERLDVPYLDTKALLLDQAGRDGVDVTSFFHPDPNSHPNAEGYRRIAEALADRLAPVLAEPAAGEVDR
ncbi:MAG: SGNH/GDSL hydrolase family protein [Acidobacteriota bacterium]